MFYFYMKKLPLGNKGFSFEKFRLCSPAISRNIEVKKSELSYEEIFITNDS